MSEAKWEVRPDPRDPNAWDVYSGEQKIAHMPWGTKRECYLIAAAPELLELAKTARTHLRSIQQEPEQRVADLLDCVIDKANGKC